MTAGGPRGGSASRGAAPESRPWTERLDDPDEPLYTIAVASDLLGVDVQTLRRLGQAIAHTNARPSGNQRRYSRNDLVALDAAVRLAAEGYAANAIVRILELQGEVRALGGEGGAEPRTVGSRKRTAPQPKR